MSTYQVQTTGGTYEVETAEEQSSLEAGLRGAGNNFPLAPQAISKLEPGDYSENLADWNQKAKEAKEEHPIAYGAGSVAGAVAPLAIPYAGEVMEAAPITTGAALGAANAISNTDLTKNPADTLKEGAEGAVLGGATSGLLGKILPKPEALENFATNEAGKSVGLSPALLGKMEPEERTALKQFIQKNNLVDVDKGEALKRAQDLEDQIGSKIGEISGKTKGLSVDPDTHINFASTLDQKAKDLENLSNAEAKKLARSYRSGTNDILGLGSEPQWDAIQKLKSQYGKLAFDGSGQIKNQAHADTYFTLKDMLKSIAEKAQGNPELGKEYKDALMGYHQIQPVIKGLTKLVGQEEAGSGGEGFGMARLIRSLPGQTNPAINLPTAALIGASGHPMLGAMAATATLGNPAIKSQLASLLAKQMPNLKGAALTQMVDYLVSKLERKK